MNKNVLASLQSLMEIASSDAKSELEKIINWYKNGAAVVKEVVKKAVAAFSEFFTSDGEVGIKEETFSFTKKEIIAFFKSGNKAQPFYIWNYRFILALKECLADYKDGDRILFTKDELKFYKNKSSKNVRDLQAIECLEERILDMKVKEDKVELLKRYATVMYNLEKQPLGQDGTFQNNGYATILGWVQLTSGKQCSLFFYWYSGNREWILGSRDFDGEWFGGRCFFSRKALGNLDS